MTPEPCPRCAHAEAVIARLRAQVVSLHERLESITTARMRRDLVILQDYRQGVPMRDIAARSGLTVNGIIKVLRRHRVTRRPRGRPRLQEVA